MHIFKESSKKKEVAITLFSARFLTCFLRMRKGLVLFSFTLKKSNVFLLINYITHTLHSVFGTFSDLFSEKAAEWCCTPEIDKHPSIRLGIYSQADNRMLRYGVVKTMLPCFP